MKPTVKCQLTVAERRKCVAACIDEHRTAARDARVRRHGHGMALDHEAIANRLFKILGGLT